MIKKNPLRGEERKIVSTRLYRSEFANLMKICNVENKTIHAKLKELIEQEIKGNLELLNKTVLTKMKEDKERAEEKATSKQKQWNFEVRKERDNV